MKTGLRLPRNFPPAYILLCVALFFLGTILLLVLQQYNSAPLSHKAVLEKAIDNLQEVDSYRLKIVEDIKPQSLVFRGEYRQNNRHTEGKLQGELEGKNLEILKVGDEELLLRQKENEGETEMEDNQEDKTGITPPSNSTEWKKASELNLEALASFFMTPEQLLLDSREDAPVKKGPEQSQEDQLHHTFYWNIDSPSFYNQAFPGLDKNNIDEGITSVYISPEEDTIKKIKLSLKFNYPEGQHLQRSVYIEYP